ncbi:Pyoverdine/dityrosine biosynthesis protein [Lysobacter silvestris]|uniref:Pyoverdine/dityrosine biosynthesis protein n=2 Tax=Solilutibacter silvestris TaxID=1645665 RepID=A0A2K1PX15_9GAMM|nr:Pyoverdine/dityrosine biosynthesis protein [Lysobacter silvestris]
MERLPSRLGYRVGLNRIQESVISSHFMHTMSQDPTLRLYERHDFHARLLTIDQRQVLNGLIPILTTASTRFCEERAKAARARALDRREEYGHGNTSTIGASESITEAILDKEFSRSGARYNERALLNQRIKEAIDQRLPIDMVIPALPFKIPSPLKSRGPLPDLGEANFLLSLYEIVRTVEIIYRTEHPNHEGLSARFTVVADGSRFNEAVNKSSPEIVSYQAELSRWTKILGLDEYVRVVDYRSLMQEGLPQEILSSKQEVLHQAKTGYSDALWPIFDPGDMNATFQSATEAELDPELGNSEGRFVSLLKSLVYTMNYRSLQSLHGLNDEARSDLYRELTAHIFHPYTEDTALGSLDTSRRQGAGQASGFPPEFKEELRRAMLNEVWGAAIHYIAEIKSDRDLDEDPILTCLPGYLRWTIHAKQGQIAIATPPILGVSVQAWAGSAVFRPTSKGKVRLCSLPVLLLEAMGAIPVAVRLNDRRGTPSQPLFYIDKEIGVGNMDGLLAVLRDTFTRRRFS